VGSSGDAADGDGNLTQRLSVLQSIIIMRPAEPGVCYAVPAETEGNIYCVLREPELDMNSFG
jgi:hypothetical protein